MTEIKKLTRSNKNKMIAGVCGGLGNFLDIDATIVRLLFAFGFIASFGTALLVYLVLAIVIPPEEESNSEV
jgi:phage shock protein C